MVCQRYLQCVDKCKINKNIIFYQFAFVENFIKSELKISHKKKRIFDSVLK